MKVHPVVFWVMAALIGLFVILKVISPLVTFVSMSLSIIGYFWWEILMYGCAFITLLGWVCPRPIDEEGGE